MSTSAEEESAFPQSARVVLHSLKTEDLNGKVGVVQSSVVTGGRQQVFLTDSNKSFALKMANLKYEERSVESLSAKELQLILKEKGVESTSTVEKSDLIAKVEQAIDGATSLEVAKVLAQAQAKELAEKRAANVRNATSKKATSTAAATGAQKLSDMSPDQLRRQAQAMKSMPAAQIRRMNPQLAHMTDAQIQMAAQQMEMMANNPDMMKAATDQMKNMSPSELEELHNNAGMANGPPTPAATAPTQAADVMSQMTPEQMRQQAKMMRSMPPDSLRQMNPQLAHMDDAQVEMVAAQLEMMADNPSMRKMAMDQMKNLSPDEIRNIQAGNAPPGAEPDMAQLMAKMDPKQIKQMLTSLQSDPEQLKNFSKMTGMPEAQLKQGVDMFSGMTESQMDSAIKVMGKAQQAKNAVSVVNQKVGGHLMKIVVVFAILFTVGLYQGISGYISNRKSVAANTINIPTKPLAKSIPGASGDDFETEF